MGIFHKKRDSTLYILRGTVELPRCLVSLIRNGDMAWDLECVFADYADGTIRLEGCFFTILSHFGSKILTYKG
jgi:hypothetical protein